ncbi:AMP-binding protein [Nocardioides jensenii]|uniref:AMP-binding protein n=1 Tax=Nocardioides jensenii TaxID=1843 RepID=UPI001FE00584|nr:AMP-binding protein [Nocardioides jensenii]
MSFLRPVHGTTPEVIEAVRAWLDAPAEPAPLIVETSGSTGRPKRVVLSRRAVLASAHAAHQRLGGGGTWLLTVPASYVAGLQVVVRALLAGADPVLLEDHESFAAAAAAACVAGGPAYLSLVPTQLHRLVETDPEALAGFDAVLLGGGPIDPALRRRAEDRGVRVVSTYGASETSGGCVYDGRPLDGVELDVRDGEPIRIRGDVLFDGYDGDPELTARTLVDGWFVTSDLGRIVDGRLQVLGRVDDVVISGGVNVPTPAVAARLRAHLAVDQVEVLGVADAEWGQRVVAFVVGDLSLEQARDWVSVEHPRAWAPRDLVRLDDLPLLPNGKIDRQALRRLMEEPA